MSISWEWEQAAGLEVGASFPGDEDFVDSDELKTTAIVLGGRTGGGLVIQGSKDELIKMAGEILAAATAIDWVEVNHFIDLGQRTNEEGYIDSIKLIHGVITGLDSERVEYKAELDQALELDLAEIDDSGQDLDTMHDLLAEWEERAEESNLHAYADGEAGVYRVTNIPEED